MASALLAEQAAAHGARAARCCVRWGSCGAGSMRRAPPRRRLPVSAAGRRLRRPARWRAAAAPQVGDAAGGYAAYFTVPAAAEARSLVFTYAWHLARSQPAAARLLLGMPAPSALVIGQCTLRQIQRSPRATPSG